MKILLLGGPRFLGYALIGAARAAGHEVTLFNRGRSESDLFPELEKRIGDRDGDLSALEGGRWDAAIDTCGYFPRQVRASAGLLADQINHYTFISSISVYSDPDHQPFDENAPTGRLEDETVEEITGETYGPLKALCEQAAEAAMPGLTLIIRPGLIVGPRDPTDRFTYWPLRARRGGAIASPESPAYPAQVIDVRDLAEWCIRMAEQNGTGVLNATGPTQPLGDVLEACLQAGGSDGRLVWLPQDFLLDQKVEPWTGLPLWLPGVARNMMRASIDRALDAGLAFRDLEETARDTLAWAESRPADYEMRAGLSPEKEAALLAAWEARASAS